LSPLKREPVHERLDRILGIVSARPSWTALEIAEEVGISLRTARRDLLRLRARGVVVDSTPGRGGGIRVPIRSGVGRVPLDYREALDLVVALALAETLRSPLLLGSVRRVRQKISSAFPTEERTRLSAVRRRILMGPTSPNIAASFKPPRSSVLDALHEAFFELRRLELEYVTQGNTTRRIIEPHYFLLSWPAWYLLVFDHLRNAVRTLRVDRIVSAQVLAAPFRLRASEGMLSHLSDRFVAI
jgi:predicted DNA-binding transcriptional regulator YafY